MTEAEFISCWVGRPYRARGNDESGIDCWALVVRYYRDVLGIELDDHHNDDIAGGFEREIQSEAWEPCDKKDAGVEEHVLELGKLIVDKYEEKYHLDCNLGGDGR